MLFAGRDSGAAKSGFLCVRKEYHSERGMWIVRLVPDRRPRNALERLVRPSDAALPQGTCFLYVVLEDDEQLRLWITDLPSFYYSILVTDSRARTNQFTEPLEEKMFEGLAAVRELHALERDAGGEREDVRGRNGYVVFGISF